MYATARGAGTLTGLHGSNELAVRYRLNVPGVGAFADGNLTSADDRPLPSLVTGVAYLLHLDNGRRLQVLLTMHNRSTNHALGTVDESWTFTSAKNAFERD